MKTVSQTINTTFLLFFTTNFLLAITSAAVLPKSSETPLPKPSIHPAPKNQFFLSNVTSAYYTSTKPVPPSLFGPMAVKTASKEDLLPYKHPRIVNNPAEWNELLMKHVINFQRENSWSKSLQKLTLGSGPLSPFVKHLAKLEKTSMMSAFSGKPRSEMSAKEILALKPIANEIMKAHEQNSYSLFLCAFWASVSMKQSGAGFLGKDPSRICIDSSVAWAKILLSHRMYHCDPVCKQEKRDSERTYLWDTDRNWEVSQDWLTGGFSLAMSYDTLYSLMDEEERTVIRSAIAMLVMNRWTWGTVKETNNRFPNAETHPHRIYGNWGMYHSNLFLTNLAIEGETGFLPYVETVLHEFNSTGFNSDMDTKFTSLVNAFVTHTFYPDGSTFEDGYTYHTALREGSLAMVALQRRGSNILSSERFRNTIHNAAQMFEPWQCGALIGHASGGGLSYPSFVALFRYAYPQGALSKMLWGQRFGKNFTNTDSCRIYWTQTMMQVALLGDEHSDCSCNFSDSPQTLRSDMQKHFPLSYVSARRGLVVTRSSYSERTSYMHFDARPDSFFLGHDNADRGAITFSALKKRWLDDLEWIGNEESRRHTLMHIDGVAQAVKAPSVTIMKSEDTGKYCITSADLSYAYNVQWARAWQGPRIGTGSLIVYDADGSSHVEERVFEQAEDHSPWDLGWPMEDDASEIGFNRTMTLNGYPDLAFAGTYQWKRNLREEALTHMVRSTIMTRSTENEVGFGVLVDVVGTEQGSHVFESYLILERNVQLRDQESYCNGNSCKVVLESSDSAQLDLHVRTIGNSLSYRVENFDGNKRLIVKSENVKDEEFWIAMHPHEGDANGFEMERADNGIVTFMYHGEQYKFGVDEDNKSVVHSD